MKERLSRLKEDVARICRRAGRNPDDITIIGVTKYTDVVKMQQAIDAGLSNIGENRVQDAREKFPQLRFAPGQVTRHLIGHLQSNKAKLAVELFDLIQSVDSLHLAEELDKQSSRKGRKTDILIQVNCSGEAQKSGIERDQALDLVGRVADLENINLCGLMTMAALTDDKDAVRQAFKSLRRLSIEAAGLLEKKGRGCMRYLSMGMSQDYEIALEEGANMLRIGRAIFGE